MEHDYHYVAEEDLGEYPDYREYEDVEESFGNNPEDAELILLYRINNYNAQQEISRLASNCAGSIFFQGVGQVKVLCLLCFLLQIIVLLINHINFNKKKSMYILHLLSCLFGFYILYDMFADIFFIMSYVIFALITLTHLSNLIFGKLFVVSKSGLFTAFLTVAFILLAELMFSNPVMWNRMRGILLLMSMKIISVSIDFDKKKFLLPNFLEYTAYCLHPGTLVFGPWISFQDYKESLFTKHPLNFEWLFCVTKSFILSMTCLILSMCVFPHLFINPLEAHLPIIMPVVANEWMLSYETAVSFHFSHYYISYLATTACLLSGVGFMKVTNKKIKVDDESDHASLPLSSWSKFSIVRPLDIEIPRSMLSVVVSWNIPMSKWLKIYVFDSSRFLGDFLAILFTYAASAMLHGLSVHLAAILLSLAVYTYAEHTVRKKLSITFHCPEIQAKSKPSNYFSSNIPFWAKLFNALWIIINLMHLAYLGSMFQTEDDESDVKGYSFHYTLSKWSRLGYASHIFAFACLVYNWLL